jgi:hypothetical protein
MAGLQIGHQCQRGLYLSFDRLGASSLDPRSFTSCLAKVSCTLLGTYEVIHCYGRDIGV